MPLTKELRQVLKKAPGRYRHRQKPTTELEDKRDDWGGLYVFSTTESLTSPWILPKGGPIFKVGMSKASIYKRLEGYQGNEYPEGMWIHFVVTMRNTTPEHEQAIAEAESWVHERLKQYQPTVQVRARDKVEWYYDLKRIEGVLQDMMRQPEFKSHVVRLYADNGNGIPEGPHKRESQAVRALREPRP